VITNHVRVEVCGKFGVTPILSEGGSVGYDISLPEDEGPILMPYNSRRQVDTGIIFNLPEPVWMLLSPRSSARKKGVRLSNTIGVIDPSYHGPEDHLIVDLTREPKKKRYLGKVSKEEFHDAVGMNQWLEKRDASIDSLLKALPCPKTGAWHYYVEDANDYMVFPAGAKFCQVLFLPYYRADLIETALEEWPFDEDGNRGGFGSTGE